MAFKVKDLMITVLPAGDKLPAGAVGACGISCETLTHCTPCSICSCSCTCTNSCRDCTVTNASALSFCGHKCLVRPEDLAALKEEMKRALAQIEEKERSMQGEMAPKSVKEAEELEQKLTEALNEVRALKAKLRKAPRKK